MSKTAIITGDLVSSRSIDATIREKLYLAIDEFAGSGEKNWVERYERFRGDSFQYTTPDVKDALRAALLMRCFILSYETPANKKKSRNKGYSNTQFDVRLSIGIGNVDFINNTHPSSSDGEAFVLSGESLDNMKKSSERMVVTTSDKNINEEWNVILSLLDAVIQKWTQNGAELALQKLMNKKDDEIAGLLKISVSAITQRKKSTQWHAINKAIQYFEAKFST